MWRMSVHICRSLEREWRQVIHPSDRCLSTTHARQREQQQAGRLRRVHLLLIIAALHFSPYGASAAAYGRRQIPLQLATYSYSYEVPAQFLAPPL